MRILSIVTAAFLAFLPFALNGYGQDAKQELKPAEEKAQTKEPGHERAPGQIKRFVAETGADGVQHVEITGGDYYFDPNYIVVKVNVPVEFKAKKAAGYVPHDLLVKAPDAGIDFKIDLKEDWQTVKFTPVKPGKYEIECGKKLLWFKSHKERGMHGVIEVVL